MLDEMGENNRRATPSLRSSPDEVDDQRNDRDDQEDVKEAPGDVEDKPAEDPHDKQNDGADQKVRHEHTDSLLSRRLSSRRLSGVVKRAIPLLLYPLGYRPA